MWRCVWTTGGLCSMSVSNMWCRSGLRVRGGSEELHYRGQDSAQLSQRGHHQTAAHGWTGGRWEEQKHTNAHTPSDSHWYLDQFSASVSQAQCVSASLFVMPCLLRCVSSYAHVCCVCVFRQTLRLHSEEEGHASGRAKERHSWVRWVWQGCYWAWGICVCVCIAVCSSLYITLIFTKYSMT